MDKIKTLKRTKGRLLFTEKLKLFESHAASPCKMFRIVKDSLTEPNSFVDHVAWIVMFLTALPLILVTWAVWLGLILCHDTHALLLKIWRTIGKIWNDLDNVICLLCIISIPFLPILFVIIDGYCQ